MADELTIAQEATDDSERRRRFEAVLGAYFEALDAGQSPDRQELLARQPDLAAELAEFFAEQERFHRLVEPLRPESTKPGGSPSRPPGGLTDPHPEDPRPTGPSLPEPGTVGPSETQAQPSPGTGPRGWSTARTAESRDSPSPARAIGDGIDLSRGTKIRYFGDYELINELGRGGMGVVYRARQLSLHRPVALKMIKAGVLADGDELRRFQNEAEAIALLDHPGIIPVYEVGEYEGQRYFSMKLVPGGNLAERLPAYRDEPKAAATLLAEVAEAVHHAHMRGILHRDLKPANILVDEAGHPHVTDFGLARKVEGDSELTTSGAILGTPSYMAPEQASGKRGSITTATDVYGLGAVLYATLTGRAPFVGDSVMDTLQLVRERAPEPPRKFNARLPRDLEVICLKCLEKDPRRRYSSSQAVADDLRAWLGSRPIAARPLGPLTRGWLWCLRHPAIAGLSAALALVTLGGAVAAGTQWRAAVRNAGQAEANARFARSNEQESLRRGESLTRSNRRLRLADYASKFQLGQREWELGNMPRVRELLREIEPAAGQDDLRGFEWHYLRHQCDAALTLHLPLNLVASDRRVPRPDSDPSTRLRRLDFNPDGTRLLAVTHGRLFAWEIPGGRAVSLLKDVARSIIDARFSPDGKWLAVLAIDLPPDKWLGSDPSTTFLEIWDLAGGKRLRATELSRAIEARVAIRPNGRQVAVHLLDATPTTYHNTVVLVDPSDGRTERQLYKGGVPGRVLEFLAYSRDGAQLAAPGEQRKAALYDPDTGIVKRTIDLGDDIVRDCDFSVDGSRLAFAKDSGRITTWSIPNGLPLQTLRTSDRNAWNVRFSPDGEHLASLGSSNVQIWDARSGEYQFLIRGASECLAYSPDGGHIAAAGDRNTIRIWEARREQGPLIHKGERVGDVSYSVPLSPDGLLAIRASGILLDATTAVPIRTFPPGTGEDWRDFVFHPSPSPMRLLASSAKVSPGSRNPPGQLVLLDVATGRELSRTDIPNTSIFLRFSPDGRWLAARHWRTSDVNSGAVTVLDTTTWKSVFTAPDRGYVGYFCAFAPDSHRLAISREDHVAVLDVPSGRERRRIGAFGGSAGAVAWSPDGRWIAAAPVLEAPVGCVIRLYNAETGSEAHIIPQTAGESIKALSFSPDGRRLASAGDDRRIRIWDTESGLELLTLSGHAALIFGLSFSPDGHRLVSTSGDTTVRIWDASPLPSGVINSP